MLRFFKPVSALGPIGRLTLTFLCWALVVLVFTLSSPAKADQEDLLTAEGGATILYGQSETEPEGEEGEYSPPEDGGEVTVSNRTPPRALRTTTVGRLLSGAENARTHCSAIPQAYMVDCIRAKLLEALNDMPHDAAYADMRAVLEETIAALDKLVVENEDTAQPKLQVEVNKSGAINRSRPIRAVKADAVASVNAKAFAILEQAETKLLRSSEDQGVNKLQYARIAQAIGSSKVLLRSS